VIAIAVEAEVARRSPVKAEMSRFLVDTQLLLWNVYSSRRECGG